MATTKARNAVTGRRPAVSPKQRLPAPQLHGALYNRQPRITGNRLEYFLTDFIQLRDWKTLPSVMSQGKRLRSWFERHTGWQLVLSGYCAGDDVCVDDHGRQILNFWRIKTNNLDSIPKGLTRLGGDKTSAGKLLGAAFSHLLDFFEVEHHFITKADGVYAASPTITPSLKIPGYVPVFVYVEFWPGYGGEYPLISDLVDSHRGVSNLSTFDAPWQFVANVRAISGRVNTYSQYWLRMVPEGFDRDVLSQQLRKEIRRAAWFRQLYRPQRVDLLIPTDYDPTQYPRSKEI